MDNEIKERLIRFIHSAFCVWEKNPSFNLSAFCTVSGIAIFGVCMIIQTFGIGVAPEPIIEVGKAAFYIGVGGSIEKSKFPSAGETR
jgi:hypothetical protein